MATYLELKAKAEMLLQEAEELRKKEVDENQLAEECADIIIRVLNFMSRKGLDADIAIFSKHQKNMTRGYLHGKGV